MHYNERVGFQTAAIRALESSHPTPKLRLQARRVAGILRGGAHICLHLSGALACKNSTKSPCNVRARAHGKRGEERGSYNGTFQQYIILFQWFQCVHCVFAKTVSSTRADAVSLRVRGMPSHDDAIAHYTSGARANGRVVLLYGSAFSHSHTDHRVTLPHARIPAQVLLQD
jgi:hypothetical protein